MKFKKNWLDKRWVGYTLAACIAVVLYLFLSHINLLGEAIVAVVGFISPVISGIIITYVIDPLVHLISHLFFRKCRSQKLARNISVAISILLVIFLMILLLVELIPQLVNSIVGFLGNMDSYSTNIQALLKTVTKEAGSRSIDISGITNLGENLLQKVTSLVPSNMDSILKTSLNIGKGVFNGVIAFILAIYFLLDKNRLLNSFRSLMKTILSEKHYQESSAFWSRCNKILIRYIVCDLLDGLIIGAANFIFMTIAGMPYSILISVVVGVTNLAPTFGPIVGGAIGAFILVLTNPLYALYFLIFTVILQTCDGYILKPKLFGGTFGVSSIWILISIIVGGRMFGVWGILLAIPFAAIFDFIWREMIMDKLKKRKARLLAAEANGSTDTSSTENTDDVTKTAEAAASSNAAGSSSQV